MLNVKTRFIGGDPRRNSISTYMGETFAERLEITLDRPTVVVSLFPMGVTYGLDPHSDPGKETRAEFGHLLRRAARDAVRGVEEAILKSLREQGHLV